MRGLVVDGVSVRFGGLRALQDVSLEVERASVSGLIGPNGAGKTTLFNVCTGLLRPDAGSVSLEDRSLDRRTPAARARAGLGRTFQRFALWETMSVRDNVSLGRELGFAGRHWYRQAWPSRGEQQDCAEATAAALQRCGLAALADAPVGRLSTGQRRQVEIARAIASRCRFMLLDEPSSGLDNAETSALGSILGQLAAEDGIGILLVEHDMSLVRSVCERVTVLEFGQVITTGPTVPVLESDEVRAAYLGRYEVA